jgi:hypothetical protein
VALATLYQAREVGLRAVIRGAISGAEKAEARKAVLDPARPKVDGEPEDWGHHLKKELEWREMPLADRQKQAHVAREVQGTNKAAKDLGLPPVKSTQDALALHQLVNGAGQHAGISPEQSNHYQHLARAEQYFDKDPAGFIKDAMQQKGIEIEALSSPKMLQYAANCAHNGTTLEGALDQYVAVEEALANDPVNTVAALALTYGVTPQHISDAIAQAQALIDSGQVK